jgi:hypothetical protein
MVLAHLGYLMPASEERYGDGEIRHPNEIDSELITLGHTVNGAFEQALAACFDVLGNLDDDPALLAGTVRNPKSADFPWLPVRRKPQLAKDGSVVGGTGIDVVEFRRPWGYPDRNNERDPAVAGNRIETPRTIGGPYPRDAMPDVLVSTNGPASNELRSIYERAGCPADTDLYNERYIGHEPQTPGYDGVEGGEDAGGTNPLGDPVVFSSYLIGQIANNPHFDTSFNLDADRGYGYLCWDWVREDGLASGLQDPRHHPYHAPVARPEGTADHDKAGNFDSQRWRPDPPTPAGQEPAPEHQPPLQLHYHGRQCVETGPEVG